MKWLHGSVIKKKNIQFVDKGEGKQATTVVQHNRKQPGRQNQMSALYLLQSHGYVENHISEPKIHCISPI